MCSPPRRYSGSTDAEILPYVVEAEPSSPVVHLDISQANRDESVFTQAQQFCPHRKNVRQHLSFGKGEHACLGQSLVYTICRVMAHALELLSAPAGQRTDQVSQ
ncbi:cytochrome P450-related protein (plasmid) [Deinococcus radiodurans R1 = ATCC 13939 = DSM 20539]|uniref:Cytochrome P450-related protein n=1 Tax=Deinococcus radiodurans (strain ATCC 13939 / DSM 20539 / JCM 16871 / CCUG 27074 / LMG 4051 / NBRC 15346 / NCIMB 9279 / VKM B-1422 / R1) TaxID=243230 RepID=Q9RZI2_DEIRA|nr:cytochrome P450-related protein [Deinococcus radiodurans R1 = ATCC 13939 = DSM 20539]